MNPATPGTIVVLAATILLILVSVSVPISKTFTFLTASISQTVSNVNVNGTITLGTFGYCLDALGSQKCSNTTLGYKLDANALLGIDSNIDLGLSDSVIKGLTYVLVLHPIAAGFAFLAFCSGAVSHIREFSGSMFTTCLASMASGIALLAFIFDIIVFSIAKKRISSSSVGGAANLGNAIWMTLAAFLLLASSGCFFCAGRCLLRRRRGRQDESDKLRPQADNSFSDRMRQDAAYAEKRRQEEAGLDGRRANNASSLPAFAEYGNEQTKHEAIPLTSLDHEDGRYSDDNLLDHPAQPAGAEALGGVGVGYGRRRYDSSSAGGHSAADIASPVTNYSAYPPVPQMPRSNTGSNQSAGRRAQQASAASGDPYSNLPSHVEPATAYMSPPRNRDQQQEYDDRYEVPIPALPAAGEHYPTYGNAAPPPAGGVGGFHVAVGGYSDPYEQDVTSPVSPGANSRNNGFASPRGPRGYSNDDYNNAAAAYHNTSASPPPQPHLLAPLPGSSAQAYPSAPSSYNTAMGASNMLSSSYNTAPLHNPYDELANHVQQHQQSSSHAQGQGQEGQTSASAYDKRQYPVAEAESEWRRSPPPPSYR